MTETSFVMPKSLMRRLRGIKLEENAACWSRVAKEWEAEYLHFLASLVPLKQSDPDLFNATYRQALRAMDIQWLWYSTKQTDLCMWLIGFLKSNRELIPDAEERIARLRHAEVYWHYQETQCEKDLEEDTYLDSEPRERSVLDN